jgi:hypothetical protein
LIIVGFQLAELCDPVGQEPFTLIDCHGLTMDVAAETGLLTFEGDSFAGIDSLNATLALRRAPFLDRHGHPVLLGRFSFTVVLGEIYVSRGFPAQWAQEADYYLVKHDAFVD